MERTVLITGFGPFPGAPFNPTAPLVHRLKRLRRPALADTRLVTHVFKTSYAAVDRDLPALIKTHRPRVILMFGLAARTPHLRIETRARNAISRLLPDAQRRLPSLGAIAAGKPAALALIAPRSRLLAAARGARVPAALSRDAGRYLCNYVFWRAIEAAGGKQGPLAVAFIHVPKIARGGARKGRHGLTLDDLTRAGIAILTTLAASAR